MTDFAELRFKPDLLGELGLPDVPYPVPVDLLSDVLSADGGLPLAVLLLGLQRRSAADTGRWRDDEPAMDRLATLLAPSGDATTVIVEGATWWVEIGPVDLTGEIVTIQRQDALIAATISPVLSAPPPNPDPTTGSATSGRARPRGAPGVPGSAARAFSASAATCTNCLAASTNQSTPSPRSAPTFVHTRRRVSVAFPASANARRPVPDQPTGAAPGCPAAPRHAVPTNSDSSVGTSHASQASLVRSPQVTNTCGVIG